MAEQHIINEIAALRVALDKRFDTVDDKLDMFDARIRKTEEKVTVLNTIGLVAGTVLTFFGWDYVRAWLTSSTKL